MCFQDSEPGSLDRLIEVLQAFEKGEISPFDLDCELMKFGVPLEHQVEFIFSILGGMLAGAIHKEDPKLIKLVRTIAQKISSRHST